jgi:DNA segregation ATPase FtsK/SpoIIIE-like protein
MNASTIAATALAGVLREHRIAGAFAGAPIAGPRTLTLALTLRNTGDLTKVLALDEAVAMRAGLERVRLARARSVVIAEFELPRRAWRDVQLEAIHRTPGRLALGLDTRGQPTSVDLHDPATAHLLIAGATGSGKTTLVRSMLVQAVADGRPLHVIDAKAELTRFYGCAATVHTNPTAAAAHLADVAGNLRAYGGSVVVIDELAALIHDNAAAAKALGRIASLGRSLDVHLIAGTQRVDKATLGDRMIVDNTSRLVGRVVDAGASALATGQAGMGAHRLSGYGDFLLVQGDQATRFVAAQAGAALDTLPEPPGDMVIDAEPEAEVGDEWAQVGRLLAASAVHQRELSSRLVKDVLSVGSTDRARRLRDQANAVLEAINAGGANVYADEVSIDA